jgi:AraC-like DNA-binding protein
MFRDWAGVINYMSIDQAPEARGSNYYHDQGCYIAPCCLTCPLSVCIEEVPGGPNGPAYKYLEIRTFAEGRAISMEEIGEVFGVSSKTVKRALSRKARAILSWRVIDAREEL